MVPETPLSRSALRTPRAAATAGIAFSLLLSISIVIIRLALPGRPQEITAWIVDPVTERAVVIALNLVPFAGIAFLWFIGVLRDRIGQHEDRFFASIFLGSGLLFVAMLFVSAALAGGLIAGAATASSSLMSSEAWEFARTVTQTLVTTYAMRMAAVFTISTATIALQLGIMPRWLAFLGYVCAVILLLVVDVVAWVELLFPFWVLLVSIYVLVASLRQRDQPHPSKPMRHMTQSISGDST